MSARIESTRNARRSMTHRPGWCWHWRQASELATMLRRLRRLIPGRQPRRDMVLSQVHCQAAGVRSAALRQRQAGRPELPVAWPGNGSVGTRGRQCDRPSARESRRIAPRGTREPRTCYLRNTRKVTPHMSTKAKVQVRVGTAWVPAHQGGLTRPAAEALRDRYREQRPKNQVRIVAVEESAV